MTSNLLILAHSGRMLAASARRAGYVPLVVDRFADLDTRRLAGDCIRVADFRPRAVLAAALNLIGRHQPLGWVYGAGVDAMPDLVQRLSSLCPLFGNDAAVVRRCVDPRQFFALLDRLGIPYPPTRWEPPTTSGWLYKEGGCGGMGVRMWRGGRQPGSGYFQRRMPGPVFTLAFLADGERLCWHGFNTLYHRPYNDCLPFLFAGAVNRGRMPRRLAEQAVAMARKLVGTLGLRGMHGLDFMLDGQGPVVLELNPRPGAALALWDTAWPVGGLGAHVAACRGGPALPARPVTVTGMRIVYAARSCRVDRSWRWPRWCRDLPGPGAWIGQGAPICTIFASGATVRQVEESLRRRLGWLERQFQNHCRTEVETE